MRILLSFFVASVLIVGATVPLSAGQDDQRLDVLFERLQKTSDQIEARSIETTIWQIWIEAETEATNQLMTAGITAMNAGNLETALLAFNRLIEVAPNFAEAWNKRATVYYLMRAYDASVNDIAQTLKLEPRHFGALSGLGLINQAIGRTKAAIKAYEQALEVNPHLFGLKDKVKVMKKALKGEET